MTVIEGRSGHPLADSLRRTSSEPRSFLVFYEGHADALLAFFVRRVIDVELALDLFAETYAQAYTGADSFRGTSDREATAWLYKIANRQLARYYRRSRVETKTLERLGVEPPDMEDPGVRAVVEGSALIELRNAVARELDRLPEPQRRAVQLRVVGEMPYADVAGALDITEQAARARVARGLKAMRERLGDLRTAMEVA